MDIRTQAALLAAIVTLALSVASLLRDNRTRVFTLFSIFAFDLFLFSLALFFLRWEESFGEVWWDRLAVVAGALVPAASLAFFLEFLGVARRPARRARNAMLAGSLSGLAVAVSPLVYLKPAKLLVAAYVIFGLAVVLSVLWNRMRAAATRVERARLRYLFMGALVAMALSTFDMLPRFGLPYPAEGLGSITLTIFMFFLSQTLQRHRLLDLHEFLGKIVVVTALGLVLVAVYGGLVSWVGERRELFYFNTVVASFVILSLFEPMRERVEEWVVATLFHERYELVRRLEALRDRSGSVIDPAELAQVVLDGLVETRRVTHASLWLLAEERPGYRPIDFRGPAPAPFLEPAAARALHAATASGQKAVLLENLDRRMAELRRLLPPTPDAPEARTRGGTAAVAAELRRLGDARAVMTLMKAGICMPLTAGERAVGFLACWDERVPEAFASDEIAALLELADRCALVIENSKLYQQMKERDRLAALGEMSAGLAHEIRNPLAAIKGAIQYLDPKKLPEDDREFLEIMVDEVNRLNGVVTQFLDYSRPLKPSMAPADVNDVLTRTFRLLAPAWPSSIELHVELAPRLPRVLCDAEQLKQVFINLAQNGFQAMPRGGRLAVTTSVTRDDLAFWREGARRPDQVEIRFKDAGPGIPDEARERIFVPFYTTKEKGTGLGLAICQRIVKAHQGTIVVRSPPGEGAEFIISLPGLREERPEAERRRDGPEAEEARQRRRARAEARLRKRKRRRA
ncbi:MAG TPA: ATP-binding protein [Anaeromyxobacteraceae bacterium]|nr:ATP-binding protein [Anaeromyxobacteraceae bacterium]